MWALKSPLGWAKRVTGSRRRFALLVWMTVLQGLVIVGYMLLIHLRGGKASWILLMVGIFMVANSAVHMPLIYLLVIRTSSWGRGSLTRNQIRMRMDPNRAMAVKKASRT